MAVTRSAGARTPELPPFLLPAVARWRLTPVPSKGARVAAAAGGRLRSAGYQGLAEVTCEFHEGVLTLRGSVPTFYLKQVAQTVVQALADVTEIVNRIEVIAPTK